MAQINAPYLLETPRGTLTFNHDPWDPTVPVRFRLEDVQGLDNATVRGHVEPEPQRDGAVVFDSFRGARYPILTGMILPFAGTGVADDDLVLRGELSDRLTGLTDSLMRADGVLRCFPTGKEPRRLTVRLLDPVDIPKGPGILKGFQLALVAGDPIVYSDVQLSVTSDALAAPEGVAVTARNAGNVPVFPVVTATGPLQNATITNELTGEAVALPGLSLLAGESVVVDMRDETVLSGDGETSLLGTLDDSTSVFFQLQPTDDVASGENPIVLTGSGYAATTRLTVGWRDGWAGV